MSYSTAETNNSAFWETLAAELGPDAFAEPPPPPQEPYSVFDSIYDGPYTLCPGPGSRFTTPCSTRFSTPAPDQHPYPTAERARLVSPTPAPDSRCSTPGPRFLTPLPNEHLPMSESLRFVTPPLAPDYRYAHTPAPELPGFSDPDRQVRSLSVESHSVYGWMAPTPEPEFAREPSAQPAPEMGAHMGAIIPPPVTPRIRGRPRKSTVSTPAAPRTPSPRKRTAAAAAGTSASAGERLRRSSTAQDTLPGPSSASSSASALTREIKVEMIEETFFGPDGEPITPRRSQRTRFPTRRYEGL